MAHGANCRILLTTSLDPAYPEENMLDGDEKTFWISTGLFPQEVLIEATGRNTNTVKIASAGRNTNTVKIAASAGRDKHSQDRQCG